VAGRDVEAVTSSWLDSGVVRPCLALERLLPPRDAEHAPRPALHPALERALSARGIDQLYTHQVQAIGAALSGRHVAIATPTASGKSLCFHLPVLDRLVRDPGATALFLYPTKALSRDQEGSLHALIKEAELGGAGSARPLGAIVFDGDTPGDVRQKAREKGRIVLTNPDMLHSGILPNHTKWAAFFQGLSFVVLDEMHTYRGVFGSHMAHVLARLRRILAFYGATPTFIGATATIGNPLAHASRLLGLPEGDIELVDRSGAPQSSRRVFVYNPPVVNAELGVRQSSLKAAVRLTADLVLARVPTILFGPSRNSVEVMLKYLRERTASRLGADPQRAIMGYRGGYLPAMRREIERGLKAGEILCVVSTNALELGIDIGELDAVVCAGYPGSIAGTWQRFGRAGRRGRQAALVLVCSSGAVDQFLAQKPEYLLETGAEQALLDPRNTEILVQHLRCAAFEAPFAVSAPGPNLSAPSPASGESYGPLGTGEVRDALEYLAQSGVLHARGGHYYYAGEAFPASHVSLRNVGWDNFVIIEQGSAASANESSAGEPTTAGAAKRERTIGELDFRAAHTMLHEQAIYQQDAEQYQVERLDFDNHKAYVRKVEPDYFTTALTYRTVTVLETFDERRALGASSAASAPGVSDSLAASPSTPSISQGFGDVKVVHKVTGYKKIKFFTHENAGYGDVHLPPMEMHTTRFWLSLSDALVDSFDVPRAHVVDALRGFGQALSAVAALSLMCDPKDLAATLGDGEPDEFEHEGPAERAPVGRDVKLGHVGRRSPTLFLFDVQPGGVGLAEHIYHQAGRLIEEATSLITGCPCTAGCPACVGPTEDSPRKRLSLELAKCLCALVREPG
jgi:DEAD/DEAH box helicase domain-containing protein